MDKIVSLPETVIESIRDFISEKQVQQELLLRDTIFPLLENYCTVLYYPQENEDNDGCHVKRIVNNEIVNFVYINTFKSIEKQIFTAAHELGHILELDAFLKQNCPAYKDCMEEQAMNKFAALLLMPDNVFDKTVREHSAAYCTNDGKITLDNLIRFSLYLMDYFFVPFKAVIIRLWELGYLSKKDALSLINDRTTVEKINDYIKNLGYKRLGIKSCKKSIKDFAELLDKAEQQEVFSKTKITYIRNKMDLHEIKDDALSNTIKFTESKSEK